MSGMLPVLCDPWAKTGIKGQEEEIGMWPSEPQVLPLQPFQLLYPLPITSFQLQVLTSTLCSVQTAEGTLLSGETLKGEYREKGSHNAGL